MTGARAFVGLGANAGDPPRRIEAALAALDRDGSRVAGAGRVVRGPYGGPPADAAPVWNTVAEIRTTGTPHDLLARLRALEAAAGRDRASPHVRTLDLDLLAFGDVLVDGEDLVVPHPRCTRRAYVLGPWLDVAPRFGLPASPATGPAARVVEHAAALRARTPGAFDALEVVGHAPLAPRAGACERLVDYAALEAWRAGCEGTLGVVPTMGALHEGHAALVRRAAAECDTVLATVFVNPLQFAPGEDLGRYPRTLDADCALLAACGADAVYAPCAEDLYPADFSTRVVVDDVSAGYEGAARPTHFAGVATVVLKLWTRTWPDRLYLGRKDAQQLAVIRRMARDLDLPGAIVACPTVRDADGLALSSRNRYLEPAQRAQATALAAGLQAMAAEAAGGDGRREDLVRAGRRPMEAAGLAVEYVDVVDASTMRAVARLDGPALALAAVRVGSTRLLDNLWIAPPPGARGPREAVAANDEAVAG